jgi:hypothetical protein
LRHDGKERRMAIRANAGERVITTTNHMSACKRLTYIFEGASVLDVSWTYKMRRTRCTLKPNSWKFYPKKAYRVCACMSGGILESAETRVIVLERAGCSLYRQHPSLAEVDRLERSFHGGVQDVSN